MKKYKFAIVSDRKVILTDDPTHHPLYATLIENPVYTLKQNSIFIKGLERVYELGRFQYEADKLDPSEIKTEKILFWSYKTWTRSWVLMKDRLKYCKLITNPVVEFKGGCE